eukprot:644253-Prymnesium_polylepis.1
MNRPRSALSLQQVRDRELLGVLLIPNCLNLHELVMLRRALSREKSETERLRGILNHHGIRHKTVVGAMKPPAGIVKRPAAKPVSTKPACLQTGALKPGGIARYVVKR